MNKDFTIFNVFYCHFGSVLFHATIGNENTTTAPDNTTGTNFNHFDGTITVTKNVKNHVLITQ
ncbi:MAG: hypothetical protein ABS944_17430 [Solibacillus sp.]